MIKVYKYKNLETEKCVKMLCDSYQKKELASGPWCTLTLAHDSWVRLQHTPANLIAGESGQNSSTD